MLDVKNCANIGGPVAGEALVRPAKGVRSEDDIIELENGVVGVRRLLFEHIEPRAGDTALLERLVSAFWSTIGPRDVLMKYAVGFIRARRSAFTRWRVSGVSGQLTLTKSERRNTSCRPTSSTPSSATSFGSA